MFKITTKKVVIKLLKRPHFIKFNKHKKTLKRFKEMRKGQGLTLKWKK